MILNNKEKKSLVDALSWMTADLKHRFDELKRNTEIGSQGDYSPELIEAITLLNTIKKTETIETTGCHRKSVELNCRDFKCNNNKSGLCSSPKPTLESIGNIVGHLKCVEAKEKSEEEEKVSAL